MIIKTKSDVRELPSGTRKVRVQLRLTVPMIYSMLDRCPRLNCVVLTNTAYDQTSDCAFRLLETKGIRVEREVEGQGRPVELSREQVERIESLRVMGCSYRKIAELIGVSHSTVARVCRGELVGKRWREEYR